MLVAAKTKAIPCCGSGHHHTESDRRVRSDSVSTSHHHYSPGNHCYDGYMANSTHRVEVVPIKLEPHPNADSLSLVRVFDHYQVVVRTEDWQGKTIAAYVPPDSVMPDKPEYSFLKGSLRIRAMKLRGMVSQGMLIPAPEGSKVGDNVAEQLGITHYNPPFDAIYDETEQEPPLPGFHYDIDSWHRFGSLFLEGMPVWFSEKIHGANARFTYQEEKFWVGSRTRFIKSDPYQPSIYWRTLFRYSELQEFCMDNPGWIVYGEVFGWVQKLRYGHDPKSVPDLRIFDIWDGKRFLNFDELVKVCENYGLPMVPVLWEGPYSVDMVESMTSGKSLIPGAESQIREGIVIKPKTELWTPEIGRLVLKSVSVDYLSSKFSS